MPTQETTKKPKMKIPVRISCDKNTLSSEQLNALASFRNMRGNIQKKKRGI